MESVTNNLLLWAKRAFLKLPPAPFPHPLPPRCASLWRVRNIICHHKQITFQWKWPLKPFHSKSALMLFTKVPFDYVRKYCHTDVNNLQVTLYFKSNQKHLSVVKQKQTKNCKRTQLHVNSIFTET